jgi:hypothetical protein
MKEFQTSQEEVNNEAMLQRAILREKRSKTKIFQREKKLGREAN